MDTQPTERASPPPGSPEEAPKSFLATLPEAFVYPFRGLGWAVMIAGAVAFWALGWIGARVGSFAGSLISLPGVGSAIAAVVGLLTTIYLCAYMLEVIGSSAKGDEAPPDWPEITYPWANVVQPTLLVIANAVFAFAPVILYRLACHYGCQYVGAVSWALVALGCVYLPMGLLAVALYRSAAGLNPFVILRGIVKVGPAYLVAVVAFFANVAAAVVLQVWLAGTIPHVGSILAGAVVLYLLLAVMRIVGMLYGAYEKRLGWFD